MPVRFACRGVDVRCRVKTPESDCSAARCSFRCTRVMNGSKIEKASNVHPYGALRYIVNDVEARGVGAR